MPGKHLILVVEDDRTLARGVTHLLEREGYRARAVHDGAGATAAVRRLRPDLILLDLDLPGLTGVEVCHRLRNEGFTCPVVMLTAQHGQLQKVIALEAGADDYVTKPFDPRELAARVRSHLRAGAERTAAPATREAQLRSVVFSDLVGFSRRMNDDEASAIALLRRHAAAVLRAAERHGGSVVETKGDEVLAVFRSEREAVAFSVEVHRGLARASAGRPARERMAVRMGIHSGDVVGDGAAVRGDTVNVAARLRELARPGTTVVSERVRSALKPSHTLRIASLGEQKLKNIRTPVHAYQIRITTARKAAP